MYLPIFWCDRESSFCIVKFRENWRTIQGRSHESGYKQYEVEVRRCLTATSYCFTRCRPCSDCVYLYQSQPGADGWFWLRSFSICDFFLCVEHFQNTLLRCWTLSFGTSQLLYSASCKDFSSSSNQEASRDIAEARAGAKTSKSLYCQNSSSFSSTILGSARSSYSVV
jgi:hypothetical protein